MKLSSMRIDKTYNDLSLHIFRWYTIRNSGDNNKKEINEVIRSN